MDSGLGKDFGSEVSSQDYHHGYSESNRGKCLLLWQLARAAAGEKPLADMATALSRVTIRTTRARLATTASAAATGATAATRATAAASALAVTVTIPTAVKSQVSDMAANEIAAELFQSPLQYVDSEDEGDV